MLVSLLSLSTLGSAIATMVSDYAGKRLGVYIAKPLTLVCLLILAGSTGRTDTYALIVLLALVLSLAGDVFLMLDRNRFYQHGLFAFLAAHLAYIAAFGLDHNFLVRPAVWLPLTAFALTYYLLLKPHLGRDRLPVIAYLVVISLMGMQGLEMALVHQDLSTGLAAIGALVFMSSDATHAWNRFYQPFRAAQAVILSTYFLAQWLIVLSLLPR